MALSFQLYDPSQQQQQQQPPPSQTQTTPYQTASSAVQSVGKTPSAPQPSQPSQYTANLLSTSQTGSPVQPNGKLAAPAQTAQAQYPTQTGSQVETGTGATPLGYPYSPYPTVNPAGAESQQYANLMQLLQNPFTMTPDIVSQMKGANRDEAAVLQQQLLDQIHSNAASRGLQVGGGWDTAQTRRAGEAAIQQILQGNRAIDLQAVNQNRQDLLNSLQYGDQMLGGAENRNLSAAQLALQRALGIGGLNMDQAKLDEMAREYNMGNKLSWADLMNNMVMGRAGYGLNLAQLQQQAQNNMFGQLFR